MANNARTELMRLVEHFEGFYARPYLCPANVPTIGFGTTHYPDGRAVRLDDPPISREQARVYAQIELEKCISNALRLSPCLANDSNGTAAIADFAYNLGAGAYRYSTLRKRINAWDWQGACKQLLRWNKAGGKVLAGLTRRRVAEAALLQTGG